MTSAQGSAQEGFMSLTVFPQSTFSTEALTNFVFEKVFVNASVPRSRPIPYTLCLAIGKVSFLWMVEDAESGVARFRPITAPE